MARLREWSGLPAVGIADYTYWAEMQQRRRRLRLWAMAALAVALVAASCGGDGSDRSVGVATLVGSESPATDVVVAAEVTAAAAGSQSDEESIPTAPASSIDASVGSGGAEASGAQPSGTEAPSGSVVSDDASQSGPSSGDGVQEDTADEDSADEDLSDEETLLLFAACMRENGLVDFEDPTVDANGNVQANQMFAGPGVQLNSEEFRQAFSACRRHIEDTTFGQAGGGFNVTEIQDTFLGFARCLRSEGIEVDDPELSKLVTGSGEDFPRRLFGEAFDLTDPAVQDAVEACMGELGGIAAGAGAGG